MSKVKSDKIPHYELMYLISNKYAENELDPIKAKVTKMIEIRAGEITYTNDIGKKRLAYPIKGFRYGYYQLVEFNMAGAEMFKLDKDLRLDNEILRHQIVKKVAMTPEQMKAEAEAIEKRLADTDAVADVPREERAESPRETVKTAPEKKTEVAEEEPIVKPAKKEDDQLKLDSDKELDSKLDNILSSDLLYK